MKTAVIYARYSSDAQTEQSIEGQVRVCKQFAEKNELLVVDSYIDRATTGTNDNRAAFQQMLKDSKRKQWSTVIVYKLDRFARNKYESVVNRKKLSDNGVELVSAMENIPDTPEGKLFLAVIEGFNEYFSEDLKQKVNRGLKESWLKGNATGGHPPYGYVIKDKKYVIDEAEADVIREVFRKYAQGFKAVSIAEDLKARNVRRKCGKYIDHKYVYVILHDKRYIGVVQHQGEEYYNIFPPIITKELWLQVDAINEENKIAPSRKKEIFDYILSSKLVCGKCKHKMLGESGTSRSGEIHYYYVCLSKRRGKTDCDCKAVKKQVLEDYVINATVAMLRKNSVITKIAETICKVHEKMIKDDSGLQILINKRNDAKKAADNIVKAIEQGIITDFTKDRLTTLQNEVNSLDIEINREMQKTYAHLSVDEVEKYLLSKVFENPDDIKTRKLLVNTFIREIIWYGDKLVITYNFQEEAIPPRLTKSHTEEVEKQVEEATRSASSFPLGSYIFRQTAPVRGWLCGRKKHRRTQPSAFLRHAFAAPLECRCSGQFEFVTFAWLTIPSRTRYAPYKSGHRHQFAAGYAVAKNTDGHSRLLFYATLLPRRARASDADSPKLGTLALLAIPSPRSTSLQVLSPAPHRNNTNQEDDSRFVLFFARDYFGMVLRVN